MRSGEIPLSVKLLGAAVLGVAAFSGNAEANSEGNLYCEPGFRETVGEHSIKPNGIVEIGEQLVLLSDDQYVGLAKIDGSPFLGSGGIRRFSIAEFGKDPSAKHRINEYNNGQYVARYSFEPYPVKLANGDKQIDIATLLCVKE